MTKASGDKVKLPKEVAETLEACKTPENQTLYSQLNEYAMRWATDFPRMDMDTILKALVNGYEVEQTPEDKVRQTFEYALEQIDKLGDHPQVEHWKGLKTGIITTLASFNIKIEGVTRI